MSAVEAAGRAGAEAGAQLIRQGFDRWADEFRQLTEQARVRFERREWRQGQHDSVERLAVYQRAVGRTVAELQDLIGRPHQVRPMWGALKAAFVAEMESRSELELALTYFSSVARRFFDTIGVDAGVEFLDAPPLPANIDAVIRRFPRRETTTALVAEVLRTYRFALDYEDLERDSALIAAEVDRAIGRTAIETLEVAAPVFFRNKGAYLVGRLLTTGGQVPFVIALLNDAQRAGITVDAVLLTEDDVSIVFSYTRSYFSVSTDHTRELVAFLQLVLPRKPVSDLYIAIGYHKRAKTELYRALLRHLEVTSEVFDFAPGARGMVMIVFNMPSSDVVFKVFRDQFDFPKSITREQVMQKYQLVFEHDRAGRLVDAQEFTDLEFDRGRFSEALLHELREQAKESIDVREDTVVIRHVYTERRVTPLDVYLRQVDLDAAVQAVLDYGAAVRDLAATNIFPGDLLLKNFGVTRHGRVAFYDYDEIVLVTDCTFRSLPPPRDFQEELMDVPWFAVHEGDVFPEEFGSFLGLTGTLRDQFLAHHGYLLHVDFWSAIQRDLRSGAVIDIFPYPPEKRLPSARLAPATSELTNHA